ncbi:MAG: D-arabinono-1,4-lactone oxidase-domain-containing protein [Benniella sp.]|nr:MAG: D-arabinono-1,4-lactone oxidase-domain-containing protein [Benniella sp.]
MISAVIATATGGPIPGEVQPLESGQITAINLGRNGSETSTVYSSTTTVVAHPSAKDFTDPKVSLILQELRSLATPKKTFENWARTFRCAPEQYFTPISEEDVIRIIQLARLSGKQVKAIGTGHSPSDLACTDGFMINTDKLNKLISVDTQHKTITVQAGMKLHRVHEILKEHNMAMSNLGSISDQSVAGVMATATHGTGVGYSTLCASVLDLTLITANGDKLYCSKTEKPDIFHAAVCSLGSLGIITQMTLQCEAAFRLENKQEPAKLNDVLQNIDSIIHSAEYVRLWWYPHTDNVVIWRANRTNKAVSPQIKGWHTSHWFQYHVYQGLLYVCRFIPRLIPTLARFMFWATQSKPVERVDDSVKVFNFDCLFPQYVNEWAIPWSRTAEALKAIDRFIETGFVSIDSGVGVVTLTDKEKQEGLKVHFPIEIRFVKKDDAWLSPAYGVDSCYIGIIMYRPYGKPVPYKSFWAGFEWIMTLLEGRPHWAKAHSVTYEGLERSYPKMKEFSLIRQRLDPHGMFLNNYLCRHLVPSQATSKAF